MTFVETEPSYARERRRHKLTVLHRRRRNFEIAAICAVAAVIVWPYLQYPGEVLYNRYFEAPVIFDPAGAIRTFGTGWSNRFHLGYPTLTELSYLSIFTGLTWMFDTFGGTAFASRAYPIVMALLPFMAMALYLRSSYRNIPLSGRLLCALFFAVNPLTAGMVHEGYSGMQVDYALIPLELWIVDETVKSGRGPLLGAFPLIFVVTGMFKLPEVAIDWAVVLALRWSTWANLVRTVPSVAIGLVASLAVNAYWALPMLLNLKLHAYLPIQDDTASEIAVSTQYSTLSNVLLGRVFGTFETDTGLCRACHYYLSAEFTLGMMLVVGLAAYGIVKARQWNIIVLLIASLAMSTGYHYQDDVIGLPYQLLMQLPTFDIFRSANVFLIVTFFCYALGLGLALREVAGSQRVARSVIWVAVTSAIVLSSWPMLSGAILEKGAKVAGIITAPNFFVRVPEAYRRTARYLQSPVMQAPDDGVTLLYPNAPFATYRWGAYIQDFLPWMIPQPTLAAWYWRQNNPDVQNLLATVTDNRTTAAREAELLSAMRVDRVLVHDDVIATKPVRPQRFGLVEFRSGSLAVHRVPQAAVPLAAQGSGTVETLGGSDADAPLAAALTGDISRRVPAVQTLGCDDASFADTFFRRPSVARSVMPMKAVVRCGRRFVVDAYLTLRGNAVPSLTRRRGAKTTASTFAFMPPLARGVAHLRGSLDVRPHDSIGILPKESGDELLALVASPNVQGRTTWARPYSLALTFGAVGTVELAATATTFVLHRSEDPSWIALVLPNLHLAEKFTGDGYANAWAAPPGSKLVILNLAQLAFLLGVVVSVAALGIVARVCFASMRFGPLRLGASPRVSAGDPATS